MRNKKNPKVDLERKKPGFFLIGLTLAIGGAIAVINLEWAQGEISLPGYDPGTEVLVEIMPTVTRVAPKVRKKVAVISDKIIIKDIIEAIVEEPDEIKLAEPIDVLAGEFDPGSDIEAIDFVPEPDEVTEAIPYVLVEKLPTFAECGEVSGRAEQKKCFEEGLMKHIASNFKYPAIELQMGLEEKIYVEFVINTKGEVDQIEVIRGNMDGFIKESKRLVGSLPKVKPAEQRGKPVNMKYTIPIKFQLK